MLGSPTPAAMAGSAGTEEEQPALVDVVHLRLDVAADGRRVGRINRLVAFDTHTVMALETGQRHEVTLSVHRATSEELEVTVAYRRDDETMILPRTVTTVSDRLEVVRHRDARLRLKMYETKVAPGQLPPARPPLDLDDDMDDPLGGL